MLHYLPLGGVDGDFPFTEVLLENPSLVNNYSEVCSDWMFCFSVSFVYFLSCDISREPPPSPHSDRSGKALQLYPHSYVWSVETSKTPTLNVWCKGNLNKKTMKLSATKATCILGILGEQRWCQAEKTSTLQRFEAWNY